MLYHYMSHEDVLDVLFANRNKMYGAYLLRKNYPERLKTSLAIMVGGMLLLGAGLEWKTRSGQANLPVMHHGRTVEVTLSKEPDLIRHPKLLPHAPQPAHRSRPLPSAFPSMVPPAPTVPVTPPRLVDIPDPTKAVPPATAQDNQAIGLSQGKGVAQPGINGGQGEGEASTAPTGQGEGDIHDWVESMPSFPGGEEALRRFFMRNLEAPEELEAGAQVKVIVRFVVDKDGSTTAFLVAQSGGTVFDTEVLRVLRKMPKWKPGIQNGRPVAVYFNLPVTFMRSE